MRAHAFLLGLIGFGTQALAGAMAPTLGHMAGVFGLLVGLLFSFAAGYLLAPASLYCAGMVKGMTFWIGWGLATATSYDWSSVLTVVPLLLAWMLGVAALGLYLGKRIRGAINGLR